MSYDKKQYRELVRSVLKYLDPDIPFSENAVEQVMLTDASESDLGTDLCQKGGGPALGPGQMEPDTEKDIWDNFLVFRPKLGTKVRKLMYSTDAGIPNLVGSLPYSIAMTRIKYRRAPGELPDKNNVGAMAAYHVNYYNAGGRATIQHSIDCYKKYCV